MATSYCFQDFELVEERALRSCFTAFKARLKVSNATDEYYLLKVIIDRTLDPSMEDRALEEIACLGGS